jgi:hypothetical protein
MLSNLKPGMLSIMKRLGNDFQTYNIPVEGCRLIEVNDVQSIMVENRPFLILGNSLNAAGNKYGGYECSTKSLFHMEVN